MKKVIILFFVAFVCISSALDIYRFPRDYMYDYDMGAYDDGYSWLDEGEPVVADNVVAPNWGPKGDVTEEKYTSITHFMISVDYDTGEKFGPLEYGIVGAPDKPGEDEAKGKSDDDLAIMIIGDGFAGNMQEYDSVFQVKMIYQCFKPAAKKQVWVRLTLIDVLEEVKNITWYWHKTCGSGIREGFQVAVKEFPNQNYEDDDSDTSNYYQTVVENGRTRPAFDFANPTYKLHSSYVPEFLLKISEGYGSQAYQNPKITLSDPTVLRVLSEDEGDSGTIISEHTDDISLKILHTCLSTAGESRVSVEISLGSFDPIRFSWIKTCAGVAQGGFEISSERGQVVSDVVSKSTALVEWDPKTPKKRVLADKPYSIFYLRTAGEPISFDHPMVTARPSHILKASIVGDIVYGAVVRQDETPLRVDYRCLQRGNATVKLTIVLSSHQHPIEFSWVKECPRFQKIRTATHENTLTANRAMFLFCFVVTITGILGGYTWIQYKRRKIAERRARLQAQQYDT